jgi:Domain of unknown function (DUF4157)
LQRRHGNQYVIGVVRRLRQAGAMESAVRGVAASGVRGAGRRLPHADRVEQALGGHRLDAVRAYTDAGARAASRDLGAEAYTVGDKIAFASTSPSLHTVAHEAAHVIQQRAGARPENDSATYLERRAEAAADVIVQGRSPGRFLPEPGSRRGPVTAAPAVQAKVSVSAPQGWASLLWGSAQAPRALRTPKELAQFVRQHDISMTKNAANRYPISFGLMPELCLKLLNGAGRRMIGDERDRVYDDTVAGAQELADAVADEAHASSGGGGGEAPERSAGPTSLPSFPTLSAGARGSGTSRFDYLMGLAEWVPVPKAVGDEASRQVRETISAYTPQHPVLEGVEEAVTGRVEALTHRPQDPRKVGEVLPWVDYYVFAGGDQDLQRAVDVAAGKMSQDEARRFKEDFEKLKLDNEMKVAASLGTGVAVGQAIGLVPHPAAKAVQVAWTATGAVALNNKLGEVGDKLKDLEEKHPMAFQVLRERRDQQLEPLKAQRRQRSEKIRQDVMEHVASPWG